MNYFDLLVDKLRWYVAYHPSDVENGLLIVMLDKHYVSIRELFYSTIPDGSSFHKSFRQIPVTGDQKDDVKIYDALEKSDKNGFWYIFNEVMNRYQSN